MSILGMIVPVILAVAEFIIGGKGVDRKEDLVAPAKEFEFSIQQRSVRMSVADLAISMKTRRLVSEDPWHNPLKEKLMDWTDQEVIDALNASLTNPEVMLRRGAGDGLATRLWGEWMRRDFDSAIAWFDGLDSASVQLAVIAKIQFCWPLDKIEDGMRFALRHRAAIRNFNRIFGKAIPQRAGSGADGIESLLAGVGFGSLAGRPPFTGVDVNRR